MAKGAKLMKWFDRLFEAVITIGALGAGFSFGAIVSGLETREGIPGASVVDTESVRRWLALCWLLFVLAVGCASACAAWFSFCDEWFERGWNDDDTLVTGIASLVSLLLQGLVVAAFLVAALVVDSYVEGVGVAAIALIGSLAVVLLIAWGVLAINHCATHGWKRSPKPQGDPGASPASS